MLSEQQIREEIARRDRVIRPYATLSFLLLTPIFVFLFWNDKTASDTSIPSRVASLLTLGLISIGVGCYRANRTRLNCPNCHVVLNSQLHDLLRSHHCRACSVLIVGEIPSPDAVPAHALLTPKIIHQQSHRRHKESNSHPTLEFILTLVLFAGLFGTVFSEFPWNLVWLPILLSSAITVVILTTRQLRRESKIQTLCPNCQTILNDRESIVLRTTRCPACNCVILHTDLRDEELLKRFKRYSHFQSNRGFQRKIHYFLWTLTLIQGFISYSSYLIHRKLEVPAPDFHGIISILGLSLIAITIYIWLTTRNNRCLYPLMVMITLVSYPLTLACIQLIAPTQQ